MNSQTHKVQKRLSEMFNEISQLLEKNNVEYFIAGGTLLGAVRHNGFIPWDDDIDLTMPRHVYDHFIKTAHIYLPSYYQVCVAEPNNSFPYLYAKIIDTRTTLICNPKHPVKCGIFIDLFPLDGIGPIKSEQLNLLKKMRLLIKIFRRVYTTKYISKNKFHYYLHNYICTPLIKLFITKYRIFKLIAKISRKFNFNDSDEIVNFFGVWKEKEIHQKAWYYPIKTYNFEGFKVKGPNNPHMILSKLYGESYNNLPPKHKQRSHHKFIHIDLNKSYLDL